jgi:hypothetical protein
MAAKTLPKFQRSIPQEPNFRAGAHKAIGDALGHVTGPSKE